MTLSEKKSSCGHVICTYEGDAFSCPERRSLGFSNLEATLPAIAGKATRLQAAIGNPRRFCCAPMPTVPPVAYSPAATVSARPLSSAKVLASLSTPNPKKPLVVALLRSPRPPGYPCCANPMVEFQRRITLPRQLTSRV